MSTIKGEVEVLYNTDDTSFQTYDKIFGVKKTNKKKCSTCKSGYTNDKSVYYAKDKDGDEFILMIKNENNEFIVTFLNFAGVFRDETIQKFKSKEDMYKMFPLLKAIPVIKKYYSMNGERLTPGIDVIPTDGLILKEVPDYEGVGLEQPKVVGGKKSRKSRKTKKTKKSRKSRK